MGARGAGRVTETTPGRALELIVTPDAIAAAAQLVADALERITDSQGRVRLAIPGGSAAASAVQAAELLCARGFDFGRLCLTWVDERCVPASAPDSNRGAVHFEPAPGVELPLYLDGERPAAAVGRVENELTTTFDGALDVVLLGMGGDGHIASLFAGHPPRTGLAAHVDASPKPPADRITLTRAMLATAQHTYLVAVGEEKRAALTRLMAGDASLPATGLPGLVVCTDLELAGPR